MSHSGFGLHAARPRSTPVADAVDVDALLALASRSVRPFECIKHLVANGNPDRLLVGAQDEPIRKLIRHTPGVPLLLIHGSTIVVESPTHTTKEAHAEAIEQQQKVIQKEEAKLVLQAKKELKQDAAAAAASSSSASSSSGAAAGGAASTKKKPLTKPPQKKKRKGPSVSDSDESILGVMERDFAVRHVSHTALPSALSLPASNRTRSR